MAETLQSCGAYELLLVLLRLRSRFRVMGNSMWPLLRPGDEILIDTRAYRHNLPHPGEIVVARHPFRPDVKLVKRVITVSMNGDCHLAGDNLAESTDSRVFGQVPQDYILGRVTHRFE